MEKQPKLSKSISRQRQANSQNSSPPTSASVPRFSLPTFAEPPEELLLTATLTPSAESFEDESMLSATTERFAISEGFRLADIGRLEKRTPNTCSATFSALSKKGVYPFGRRRIYLICGDFLYPSTAEAGRIRQNPISSTSCFRMEKPLSPTPTFTDKERFTS